MKTWLIDILDALLLRSAAFVRVAARPDAFFHGLLVIVVAALVGGAPVAVRGVIDGFRPPAVVEPSDWRDNLAEPLATLRPFLRMSGIPENTLDQILGQMEDNAALAGSIVTQVQQADTAFPRPLAQGLMALGRWLSRPFANSPWPLATATLATWLGYGVWVMLVAKLLGGQSTLHGFFGATAYFAAPHILNVFSVVAGLGTVLSVVASLWGLAIYVTATAATHRLSLGRAVLAVFIPILALFAVLSLLLLPLGLFALLSGGSR